MKQRARTTAHRLVPSAGFRKDVAILFTGSAAGQAVVLLCMPLLSRLYDPLDFGVFAVFSTLESILVVCASFRYEQAVVAADREEDAANLLGVALFVAGAVTVATGAVALVFAEPVAGALGVPGLAPYLVLLPVALAADAGYQAFTFWAVRREKYRQVAQTKLLQGTGQSGAQLALGIAGAQPGGLLWGWTLGRLAGLTRLVRSCREDGAFRAMSPAGMRSAASRFRRFPVLAAPGAFLNVVSLQAPGLALAALYSARSAGLFLLATRVVAVPATLIGQSVSQAFIGRTSPAAGPAPGSLVPLVRRTVGRLVLLAAVPALAVMVAGPQIFTVVFGAEWREAGEYARLLTPGFLAQFAVAPVAWVLTVRRRQSWQLAWDGGRFVLIMGAVLIPAASGAARSAVLAYGVILTISYVVLLLAVLAAARDDGPPSAPDDTPPSAPGDMAQPLSVAAGGV